MIIIKRAPGLSGLFQNFNQRETKELYQRVIFLLEKVQILFLIFRKIFHPYGRFDTNFFENF